MQAVLFHHRGQLCGVEPAGRVPVRCEAKTQQQTERQAAPRRRVRSAFAIEAIANAVIVHVLGSWLYEKQDS